MKLGSIFCLIIAMAAVTLCAVQYLIEPLSATIFIRAFISLVALLLISLAIILVTRESQENEKLNKNNQFS